jgi:hypothetical protein
MSQARRASTAAGASHRPISSEIAGAGGGKPRSVSIAWSASYPLPPVRQPGTRTIAQDLHAAGSAHRRKLPANPAHHPARGLARSPRIVQIPSDRVTRGKSRMPGSQGGQGSGVGKVHGRGGRAIRHGGILTFTNAVAISFLIAIATWQSKLVANQLRETSRPATHCQCRPSNLSHQK